MGNVAVKAYIFRVKHSLIKITAALFRKTWKTEESILLESVFGRKRETLKRQIVSISGSSLSITAG